MNNLYVSFRVLCGLTLLAAGGMPRVHGQTEPSDTEAPVPVDTVYAQVEQVTAHHLRELEQLLETVPEEARAGLTQAYQSSVRGREQALASLRERRTGGDEPGSEADADAAVGLVAESTRRNVEALARVLDQVPEEAQPAIEQAMERSLTQAENAVRVIRENRSDRRQGPAGRSDGVDIPDRPERPELPERPEPPRIERPMPERGDPDRPVPGVPRGR